MDMILIFFCIIYTWVNLQNPGAQVVGGVGVVAGILLAFAFGLPFQAIAVVGLVAGNFLGGRIFVWFQQQYEIDRQNHFGDLVFNDYVPPRL